MGASNRTITITVVLAIAIIGAGFGIYNQIEDKKVEKLSSTNGDCKSDNNPICIGLILPLTGDLSTHGKENRNSTEFAVKKFNEQAKEDGQLEIKLYVKDSATNPVVALEQMKKLHEQGIKIILGLEASENIKNIIKYAENNDMVLLSCCSSSFDKSLVSHNLFRLVPDDSKQGAVLAQLLHHDGIERVIPVWRNDIWGNSLYEQTRNNFEEDGGTFEVGINYHPNSPSSVDISKLNEMIREHIDSMDGRSEKVAVLFLSFKEIAQFIESAKKLETAELKQVKWYGPGAITKEREIEKNLQFSQKIDLTTVQVSSSMDNKTLNERNEIREIFEKEPNSFVYSSYDAVWIIGKVIQQTNGKTDKNSVISALETIAANHNGTIGPTTLNAQGDLAQANYTVWKFQDGIWNSIGYYTNDENSKMWKFIGNMNRQT